MSRLSIAEINPAESTPQVAVSGYDNLKTTRNAVALYGKDHADDPSLVDEMVSNLDTMLAIHEAKQEAGIATSEMTHIVEADPEVTEEIGRIIMGSLTNLGDKVLAEQDAVISAGADFMANSGHLSPHKPPIEVQHPRAKIGEIDLV